MKKATYYLLGFFFSFCLVFKAQSQSLTDSIDIDEHYKIYLESVYKAIGEDDYTNSISIKVVDKKTGKVVHTPDCDAHNVSVGIFYEHTNHSIGNASAVFLKHHTGGEGMVEGRILYIIVQNEKISSGSFTYTDQYQLIDLDGDQVQELILTDYNLYKFTVESCKDLLFPDPYYEGSLGMSVFTLDKGVFHNVVDSGMKKKLISAYVPKLEVLIGTQFNFGQYKDRSPLYLYAHYFYLCNEIGKSADALKFIKTHNQLVTYTCENLENSFQTTKTIFDFFTKYESEILKKKP